MLIQKEMTVDSVNIQSYQPGAIRVSGQLHTSPILLEAQSIKSFSHAQTFLELTPSILESLTGKDTEILLIGTGPQHQMLTAQLIKPLHSKGIPVESMTTRHACHTFQVLVHENRKVVALLFP